MGDRLWMGKLMRGKQSHSADESGDSVCCVFGLIWCWLTRVDLAIKLVCCLLVDASPDNIFCL